MPVQLLRHIVYPGSSPEYRSIAPAGDVQTVVDEFFQYSFRRAEAAELALSNGLPVLLFMPDKRVCVRAAAEGGGAGNASGYVVGPVVERAYIRASVDIGCIFGVRFAVCGLHALLGQSVEKLRHRHSWSVRELWGVEGELLAGCVAAAETPAEKQRIVEDFVRKHRRCAEANPLFEEAVRAVDRTRGQVNIDELCSALHLNYKWLERQFRKYLGIAPKEYARLQRFTHAFFEAQQADTGLVDVAVRNGYYDQSHFIREFRRFTGKAPGEYVRTVLRQYISM